MTDFDFTYISLGAGVQSSAVLVCSALGLHGCPKAEVAIFADTGDEPGYVYDYLKLLAAWAEPRGIRVVTAQKGVLSATMAARLRGGVRYAGIPAFTVSEHGQGILRRQCTREFKIEPIHRKVRELLGYAPRKRMRHRVRSLQGISIDEAHRMKPARERWLTIAYPLVEAELTRRDCERIVVAAGLPKPRKSACVFCPFHSDAYWREMKRTDATGWEKAVMVDGLVRDLAQSEGRPPAFLHRSLLPLVEVDFDPTRDQADMFGNECDGVCGV